MPSRCAVLIWEAITNLEADSQLPRVVSLLDSRWAQNELGKSSSRSRGDAAWVNAVAFHPIGSQGSPCRFGLEEEGLSWKLVYENQAAKTPWKRKNSWCSDALVCTSGWFVAEDQPNCFSSDTDPWFKAWMLYWCGLADSVGVNGAVHVDCGSAVLLSQILVFLTPFPMLRISECWLDLHARMPSLKHCNMHLLW